MKRKTLKMALKVLNDMEQNYGNLWQVSQTPEELDSICNALREEIAKPEPVPVFWFGANGGFMPNEVYQDWSKAYPNDAKYFSPLYTKGEM